MLRPHLKAADCHRDCCYIIRRLIIFALPGSHHCRVEYAVDGITSRPMTNNHDRRTDKAPLPPPANDGRNDGDCDGPVPWSSEQSAVSSQQFNTLTLSRALR